MRSHNLIFQVSEVVGFVSLGLGEIIYEDQGVSEITSLHWTLQAPRAPEGRRDLSGISLRSSGFRYQFRSDTNCHLYPCAGRSISCLCRFWITMATLIVSFCLSLNLYFRDSVVTGIQGALLILLLPLYYCSCCLLLRLPPW